MFRLEQPVDQRVVGTGGFVGEKLASFFQGGRQAGQIERGPLEQCQTVGIGIDGQTEWFEFGEHKGIDRVADPFGRFDARGLWSPNRLKSPVGSFFGGDPNARIELFRFWFESDCSFGDPAFNDENLFGGDFFLTRWHLTIAHPFEQHAFCGKPGRNDRSTFTPCNQKTS